VFSQPLFVYVIPRHLELGQAAWEPGHTLTGALSLFLAYSRGPSPGE